MHRTHRTILAALVGLTILLPTSGVRSAPTSTPINLGPLAVGGTASASSMAAGFFAAAAFDSTLYGVSKVSTFEDGWVSRTGAGSWIERQWPGAVQLVAISLARRSNPVLPACDQPRLVSVDTGHGQPTTVELPDTNGFVRFPIAANATRAVRVTIQSVWGTGCTTGNVGFSEIELYGVPKNWTPTFPLSTAAGTFTPTPVPPAAVRFAYDGTIPADAQAYLTALLDRLQPVMDASLGYPLADQTLTLTVNPAYGSFAYSWPRQTLVLSRLPNASLGLGDPSNLDFNANLAHELAHAWQAGYGFGVAPWFREGSAQAAADLVGRVLADAGTPTLAFSTVGVDMAVRTYDSLAAMGPEALAGLWSSNGRFLSYANAEGLWWLLTLSQSPGASTGRAADLTFLRTVNAALRTVPTDGSDAGYRALLASVSPNPIDGLPADSWLARQPITWNAATGTAFGVAPLDCLCDGASATQPQHLFLVDQSFGLSQNGVPVRITLTDPNGTLISDQTIPFTDYGFGYDYYTFPIEIAALPAGRYTVAAEALVNGIPVQATTSLAVGSRTLSANDGFGLVRSGATSTNPLAVTSSVGTYSAASPTNGVLAVPAETGSQDAVLMNPNDPVPTHVFLPAPFSRFVAIP